MRSRPRMSDQLRIPGCAIGLLAAMLLFGCRKSDAPVHFAPGTTMERPNAGPVTAVTSEDAEMNTAIDHARKTLDGFIAELRHPKKDAQYLVKAKFETDAGESEHIWLDKVVVAPHG